MNRLSSDVTRAIGPANPMDAHSDGRGVRFNVACGSDLFECLVLSSALQALDVYGILQEGLVGVFRKHQRRIEERAQRLVAMGLRGSRLVLYPHHFTEC